VAPDLARGSLATVKRTWRVQDFLWYQSRSSVGQVLILEKLHVIMEFDGVPTSSVLGGWYRVWKVVTFAMVDVGC
jgi:hypothetical protein